MDRPVGIDGVKDEPIGGKPDLIRPPPLPPLFPVEQLLRQLRVVHVAFVLGIFALGTAWGFKLEYRLDVARDDRDKLAERVADLERTVSHGILPLAEERLNRIAARVESGISAHDELRDRIDQVQTQVERHMLEEARRMLELEQRLAGSRDRRMRSCSGGCSGLSSGDKIPASDRPARADRPREGPPGKVRVSRR